MGINLIEYKVRILSFKPEFLSSAMGSMPFDDAEYAIDLS